MPSQHLTDLMRDAVAQTDNEQAALDKFEGAILEMRDFDALWELIKPFRTGALRTAMRGLYNTVKFQDSVPVRAQSYAGTRKHGSPAGAEDLSEGAASPKLDDTQNSLSSAPSEFPPAPAGATAEPPTSRDTHPESSVPAATPKKPVAVRQHNRGRPHRDTKSAENFVSNPGGRPKKGSMITNNRGVPVPKLTPVQLEQSKGDAKHFERFVDRTTPGMPMTDRAKDRVGTFLTPEEIEANWRATA
jgi:hypothetical protein